MLSSRTASSFERSVSGVIGFRSASEYWKFHSRSSGAVNDGSVIDYSFGFIGRYRVARDLYWGRGCFFLFEDFSFAFRVAKYRLCICCTVCNVSVK